MYSVSTKLTDSCESLQHLNKFRRGIQIAFTATGAELGTGHFLDPTRPASWSE